MSYEYSTYLIKIYRYAYKIRKYNLILATRLIANKLKNDLIILGVKNHNIGNNESKILFYLLKYNFFTQAAIFLILKLRFTR